MTPYESYLPEVLIEIEECPEIIATDKIKQTVIDFCKRSLVWRYDLDPISVVATVDTYEAAADDFETVIGVTYGYLVDADGNNIPLTACSEDTLDAKNDSTWRTDTGNVKYIMMAEPPYIKLVTIPDAAYTLYAGVWISPSRDSSEAPDFIYDKYLETIGHGARARILNMKTKPWYNPQAAQLEMIDYDAKVIDALNDAGKSHSREKKSVAMRPFA